MFAEYILTNDLNQQRKYLEALTYTRLPWLIAGFIKSERETGLRKLDTFDAMRLLAKNPTGREIVWDYFRINFGDILDEFGLEDPRIGQLLLDITSSFENEFMFYEVSYLYFHSLLNDSFLRSFYDFLKKKSCWNLFSSHQQDRLEMLASRR